MTCWALLAKWWSRLLVLTAAPMARVPVSLGPPHCWWVQEFCWSVVNTAGGIVKPRRRHHTRDSMKSFQHRPANKTSSRRSKSFAARPAGPAVRTTFSKSTCYVPLQTARCSAYSSEESDAGLLAMIASDAVKQPAPFAPRAAHDAVADIDILGIGQAAVDYAASVDETVLDALNVLKGGRRVIGVEERARVMEVLQGYDSQVSAGGSLANTLVGLGQLAAAQQRVAAPLMSSSSAVSAISSSTTASSVKVAMTGCVVGSDALGEFAAAQLGAAGVEVVPTQPPTSSATGVVMVFTTSDAQRSFLSSFSSEDRIVLTDELKATIARARIVVVEGYMWEVQGAGEVLPEIIRHARSCGTLVALTAGDVSVIERHATKVLAAIEAGVDLWFGNEAEAAALVQHVQQQKQQRHQQLDMLNSASSMQLERLDSSDSSSSSMLNNQHSDVGVSHGQECALELAGICPMVVVTDGSRGSYITALGQLVVVPPYWRATPPVDTCGAGDAYAAGLLYGFLRGLDLHSMGHVAAKTASAVISRHGPQLLPEDADWVAAGLAQQQGGFAAAAAIASAAAAVQKGPVSATAAGVVTGVSIMEGTSGLSSTVS